MLLELVQASMLQTKNVKVQMSCLDELLMSLMSEESACTLSM